MGYITIVVLGLTILTIVCGVFMGFMRGLNHSLLRLALVIVSAVLAVALHKVIVTPLLEIKINGLPILDYVFNTISTNFNLTLPESLQNIARAMVEILLGFISYFILFYAIKFLTWAILYPIGKKFIKKGPSQVVNEKKLKFKRRPLLGAVVGLCQGLIIAFCVFSPATGLLVQIDDISKIKTEGNSQLFVVSEEFGLTEYHESTLGKTYIAVGDWYFNLMASNTTKDGKPINIHDSVDLVSTAIHLLNTVPEISNNVATFKNESATYHEKAQSLSQVGDNLIEIGNNIDALSPEAKDIIETIITDVVASVPDQLPEEVEEILGNISLEEVNLVGVGESVKGISNFIDKVEITNTPEEVTQEDVDLIIHGLALNSSITNSLGNMTEDVLIDVAEMGFGDQFSNAINNVEDAQTKETLLKLFGLNP